jgi:hypothetical protein
MKKIVIPAILTATVLLAGMFAFMPVEKASTVHTTILNSAGVNSDTEAGDGDIDNDSMIQITGTEPFCVLALYIFETDAEVDADDAIDIVGIEIDDSTRILDADGTEPAVTIADPDTDADDIGVDILGELQDDAQFKDTYCAESELDFELDESGTGDISDLDPDLLVITQGGGTVVVDVEAADD